jgi:signal transduction histidine kinase
VTDNVADSGACAVLKRAYTDDRGILRIVGLALPLAVWFLGVFSNRPDAFEPAFLIPYSALLVGLVIAGQTAPGRAAPPWRRLLWLTVEVVLSFAVVEVQGSLVRPALIYILPASQALQMFGPRRGIVLSLITWAAYGLNLGLYAWPDRLDEVPNYLSFFLAFYSIGSLLTLAAIQQAWHRHRVQALYQELQDAYTQLQAMHEQARQTAIVGERNRLAREIHDSLAHYLTIVNLQLEAAEKLGPGQIDQALTQVRRARRLAVDCLHEVRRSVAAMRAPTLETISLPPAIRKLAADFSESTGIAVTLDSDLPDDIRLSPESSLTLFRTAQEGLTNVQKHAKATSVHICLVRENGYVGLTVEDDGIGPEKASQESVGDDIGFGLIGLRERLALLEGDLEFGPGARGGSRLTARLPVAEQE